LWGYLKKEGGKWPKEGTDISYREAPWEISDLTPNFRQQKQEVRGGRRLGAGTGQMTPHYNLQLRSFVSLTTKHATRT